MELKIMYFVHGTTVDNANGRILTELSNVKETVEIYKIKVKGEFSELYCTAGMFTGC